MTEIPRRARPRQKGFSFRTEAIFRENPVRPDRVADDLKFQPPRLHASAARPIALARSLKREDAFPVVFDADHGPAIALGFLQKRGREGADLAVGQATRRA